MACVIAAPSSGSGKTIVSLALTSWARQKRLSIQPFKAGPDYLDPQQLTKAAGRPCRNLDLLLCGTDWVSQSFHGFGGDADLALIEGVMGLFDGIGTSQQGSTAAIAKHLKLPVVMVIDARGQAGSIAALVKGFREHDPDLLFEGVVLNKVNSERHKELLVEVLSSIGIKVLGCLPKDSQLALSSRYLGLAPAHEIEDLKNRQQAWAKLAESHLDIKNFLNLLQAPRPITNPIETIFSREEKNYSTNTLPIAVAEDDAFHFRYPETKECLEALQIPLIPWRPIEDEPLPPNINGLIIPGGFPEQYAARLSNASQSMKALNACFGKHPIYAECGGMMILGETLTDLNGEAHPMAGLLPFNAKQGSLKVGYRNINGTRDSLLIEEGQRLIGHEFHKWELNLISPKTPGTKKSEQTGLKTNIYSPWEIEGWKMKKHYEGWSNQMLHASWIHLHWASSPVIPKRWRSVIENKSRETSE